MTNLSYSVDAGSLSRRPTGSDATVWWGILGLIIIELTVVFAFVISGLYLQMMSPAWPPSDYAMPDLLGASVNLVILLISCITMHLAGQAISHNRTKQFVSYAATSVLLACLVLFIRWQRLSDLSFGWDGHAFGSLVWTLSGFHFLHLLSAVLCTATITLLGVLGFFNQHQRIAVVVDTLYWNFVALAWVPFYYLLFWAPRLF